MLHTIEMLVILAYAVLLAVLSAYGLHRLWMVWTVLRLRRGGDQSDAGPRLESLPSVTVQLPMYNEANVAQRIIEATAALSYPRELLQIQVLDDSTDESAAVARQCCQRLADAGVNITYLHRDDRWGYKAGALAKALPAATGELIAIFDADFVPPADYLQRLVPEFANDRVGMVQARWDHLNRDESLLTRLQALLLDGHFAVEQRVRHATGRWFNFNGTAGIWRRRAIDDAGGWRFDTLTEDTDLSYRAQLAGWIFVYRDDVGCPAELPPTMSGFISQQNRWNKGLIETALKLLPRIARSDAPLPVKVEAWFHLTSPLLYSVLLLLVVLAVVFVALQPSVSGDAHPVVQLSWLASIIFGTCAASVFFLCAQWRRRSINPLSLLHIPLIMALCTGMSVTNTMAIAGAVLRRRTPFIRTPKFNTRRLGTLDPLQRCRTLLIPCGWVELTLAAVLLICVVVGREDELALLGAPFVALFALGFAMVGAWSVRSARRFVRLRSEHSTIVRAVSR